MEEVICSHCGKIYLRTPQRINEAIKYGWKQYCTSKCQYTAKSKQKEFKCGNSQCNKIFTRAPNEIPISGKCYCSISCSVIVNNKIRESKRPKKYCLNSNCHKIIPSRNKYCSNKCSSIVKTITNETYINKIINKIQKFYKNHNRIPMKREMWGIHHASRRFFGSWNNAVAAAGFKPNPVMFAEKHVANDGHKCDSLAEKIIDDWLFARKIKHQVKVPYKHNRMTADFKIGNTYIEFFGLYGQHKKYDEH
ncbi:MAG: hypothetical protein Q7R95_04985, partial [bacterium]|nr:hypothetical protein [bacterium]